MQTIDKPLDVKQFIDEQPLTRYQWRIAVLCFLIVFLDGLDTSAMGFIAPALTQDWGIDRSSLGPVMSAALMGMVVGALASGPLADRFGRKSVLLGSVLIFGVLSVATSFSTNVDQLLLLRLGTGLGLGAAMPNATTLLSEYTPERLKSLLVTCMFCGFNFGMAAGGFISANLIPAYGWHSLLLLGGVLPIALALIAQVRGFSTPERTGSGQNVLRLLFSNTYRTGTLLLWVTYFMGLVVVFLLTSWLPTLLRESGTSMERAALIGGLFQFGGVLSAVLVGWAMDHFNPHKVIGLFYGLTALLVYIVGQSLGHADLLPWLVLLAGMCINGAQSAMPSLAARFYPTHGRATGVSWMLGIGRFGGILGAWMGATLLGLGWSFEQVLTGLILPASLACAALLIKGLMTHSDADETAYARQS